jgi:hypothetical protein
MKRVVSSRAARTANTESSSVTYVSESVGASDGAVVTTIGVATACVVVGCGVVAGSTDADVVGDGVGAPPPSSAHAGNNVAPTISRPLRLSRIMGVFLETVERSPRHARTWSVEIGGTISELVDGDERPG